MQAILHFLSIVVPFILVLTVVVFIHEFGHFIVARWCKVGIRAFSIGFGREIIGFTDRHGTRWKFCWLPLGGYVRFIDDDSAASTSSKDGLERLTPEERKSAFQNQPLLNRALVVAAGPVFNIVSAAIIYVLTFWLIGTYGTAPVVDEVLTPSAAERAGLAKGDRVTEIQGKPIKYFGDLQRIVSQHPGQKLEFIVDRAGKSRAVAITPELREIVDPIGNKVQVGVIGVKRVAGTDHWEHETHSLPEATWLGIEKTADISWQIITSLPRLPRAIFMTLTGQRQSDIGGPIAIAEMTAQASKSGIPATLGWLAAFSIMLGIMNLLPIPILDGGHLMFYGIEAVRGRPLDEKKQELGFRIGLAILATMMFAAILGDIMRKLGIG